VARNPNPDEHNPAPPLGVKAPIVDPLFILTERVVTLEDKVQRILDYLHALPEKGHSPGDLA